MRQHDSGSPGPDASDRPETAGSPGKRALTTGVVQRKRASSADGDLAAGTAPALPPAQTTSAAASEDVFALHLGGANAGAAQGGASGHGARVVQRLASGTSTSSATGTNSGAASGTNATGTPSKGLPKLEIEWSKPETKSGASSDWKNTNKATLGVSDGRNHSWDEFGNELTARGAKPREYAAYGQAGGQAGVEGTAEAKAATQSMYGSASASADANVHSGVGGSAVGYADSSLEGLFADGKIGAGGEVKAEAALVAAHAGASAKAGGGPAVGGIDPTTGQRRHLAHASAGASADAFVGAKGGAAGEAYFTGLAAGAAGKAGAEVAARVEGQASGDAAVEVGGVRLAGLKGSIGGKGQVRAGADAEGEVSASLVKGLFAAGSASAEAMARAEGGAAIAMSALGGEGKMGVQGKAEAGAMAGANGVVGVGPGTFGAAGKAEAFAGARAEGSISMGAAFLGVDVFTAKLTGSVAAGAGAGVGGGFLIKDGVLTINLEVLAAAGVGGSVGGTITIDFFSPFKMLLGLLEANGVLSSNPEEWIANVIGGALDPEAWKKRMEGGFYRNTDSSASASAGGKAGAWGGATAYAGHHTSKSEGLAGVEGKSEASAPAAAESGSASRVRAVQAKPAAAANANAPRVANGPAAVATDARPVNEAIADLTTAHGLATGAAVEAQQAIAGAMTTLMNGAANPVHLVGAILKGAVTAIEGLVRTGLASAFELAGAIARAAERAIASIVQVIIDFLISLFTGGRPDPAAAYQRDKAAVDAAFAGGAKEIEQSIEHIKTERLAEAQAALRDGFLELGMEFVRAAGGGLEGPTQKAQKARDLAAAAAAKPVAHPDGSVTPVDAKAVGEISDVADLVGRLAGAAHSGKDLIASGGSAGASKVTSAEAGLAQGAATGKQHMKDAYEQPTAAQDERVARGKAEAPPGTA